MGICGSSARRITIDSAVAQEYKDALFDDIDECYYTFKDVYGTATMTLDATGFDEVFGLLTSDPDEHFEVWKNKANGTCNVFEVFAAFYLLSCEELMGMDSKVAAVFKLFDFDDSNTLDSVEIEVMLEACIHGLSRATGAEAPFMTNVDEIVRQRLFPELGRSLAKGTVELNEFKSWISAQPDVMSFLAAFTTARLISQEQRNVEAALHDTIDRFKAAASGSPPELNVAGVTEVIQGVEGSPPTDEEIRVFIEALDQNGGTCDGRVQLDEFSAAILPWISFSVIDVDRSRCLSRDELKVLIWISDGVDTREPTTQAINRATAQMDVDKNGKVDRLEWIMYNADYDAATGSMKFATSVKEMWRALDKDGSHQVTVDEIRKAFVAELDLHIGALEEQSGGQRKFTEESKSTLSQLVQDAAVEVVEVMDAGGDGSVEWSEFKKHQRIIVNKQTAVKTYAETLLGDDKVWEEEKGRTRKRTMVASEIEAKTRASVTTVGRIR